VELLFNGREEAVEVDVEEAEAVGLGVEVHAGGVAAIIFAVCLPEGKL
jgi:hypothetical protein